MRVLAVDDDPLFLELLSSALASVGFDDVTRASSAQEAAQIIVDSKPPFDCCFIDLRMPEIEGDYLCRWIRKLPEYRDKTILMITAAAEKRDVERSFVAGASDYMTKPLDLSELVERARQIARSGAKAAPQKGRKPVAQDVAETEAPAFSEPMRIEGVRRAIDLSAMENYLFQLSASESNDLSAVAFRIAEGAGLHLRCSPAEFGRVLSTVARAILNHARLPHPVISYAGYGLFVIVSDAAEVAPEECVEIGAAITAEVAEKGLAQDNGTPIAVTVSMAEPKPLGSRTGQQMVDALYHAIVDAEASTLRLRLLAS